MPSLHCHHRTWDLRFRRSLTALASLLACGLFAAMGDCLAVAAADAQPYVVYEGKAGPGQGKHIVLISGDEEYRSEEGLPQLGKILAKHHGFKCTVLFAVDPKTGEINPNVRDNIPGLEALKSADLMVIATRFRDLPDDQMKHIVDYLEAGKPVIGMRTATHAFNIRKDSAYHKYDWRYGGDDYTKGFGKQVLGETWVAHHGRHKHESTRGIVAPDAAGHPILRGIADGEIWGPTDVYTVTLPLPGDSRPLVLGQVLKRLGEFDQSDRNFGMRPDDPPLEGEKNDPMMPIAWTRSYKGARVFCTTMGSSTDLLSEGVRRMLVNAAYWCLGLEDQIADKSNVGLVGEYEPTAYGFNEFKKGVKPSDHAWQQ